MFEFRQQSESAISVEEALILRRQQASNWTLDRGAGYYQSERDKHQKASLCETGRHAGRSRIKYTGVEWSRVKWHIWKRDFYHTAVNMKLWALALTMVITYNITLLLWAVAYYGVWWFHRHCFVGFYGFRSAFLFSIETQQTIGYGVRAPGECWFPAWMVAMHSILSVALDSIFLGIIFARISHPKNRGRTILISDSACIARRDGNLKFMFRVCDIRTRQVINPVIKAFLYTWQDRYTAEGEHQPVRVQPMDIGYMDGALLLPVTVEHNIDERSPLFGHTLKSLEAIYAEIIVILEGANEFGDAFMSRQSYLPSEIHWGHTFVQIITQAPEGSTQHHVDLARFHDVEPQPVMHDEMISSAALANKVVMGPQRTVPGRILAENTLVLAEEAVVAVRDGKLCLMIRVGDTYPGQMLDVQVRAFVYRWLNVVTAEGENLTHQAEELELHPSSLMLRYPETVLHHITERSPISNWGTQGGIRQDSDAELVVIVKGTMYRTSLPAMRSRVYPVLGGVKWGYVYSPVVISGVSNMGRARINWGAFHSTTAINMPGSCANSMVRSVSYQDLEHTPTDKDRDMLAAAATTATTNTSAATSAAAEVKPPGASGPVAALHVDQHAGVLTAKELPALARRLAPLAHSGSHSHRLTTEAEKRISAWVEAEEAAASGADVPPLMRSATPPMQAPGHPHTHRTDRTGSGPTQGSGNLVEDPGFAYMVGAFGGAAVGLAPAHLPTHLPAQQPAGGLGPQSHDLSRMNTAGMYEDSITASSGAGHSKRTTLDVEVDGHSGPGGRAERKGPRSLFAVLKDMQEVFAAEEVQSNQTSPAAGGPLSADIEQPPRAD